jgi:hypothetical protein
MSNGFRVSWGMVRSWIHKASTSLLATDELRLRAFHKTLFRLQDQLSQDPIGFGEPYDDLHDIDVTRCVCFMDELVINYGVNRVKKVVFVTKLRWRKRAS